MDIEEVINEQMDRAKSTGMSGILISRGEDKFTLFTSISRIKETGGLGVYEMVEKESG